MDLTFRSALLTPWLRGSLSMTDGRIHGVVPRSFLGLRTGERVIDVPIDAVREPGMSRTRQTPLGWIGLVALCLPELGIVALIFALLPILYLLAPVFILLGPTAGWISAALAAVGVFVVVALHGWSLIGITDMPIPVSWADRAEVRAFADRISTRQQLRRRPGTPTPW